MSRKSFHLRTAQTTDSDAVSAVLASAYPQLMAPDYDPAILALVLPAMIVANPGLLASGQYYVQEVQGGRIVACGGWTHEEPGSKHTEPGIGHVRHFGTHVDWTRQGFGAGIVDRCRQEALAAGMHTFKCFSSLGAEAFYRSLGFHTVERQELTIGGTLKLPTLLMVCAVRAPTAR